MVEAARQSPSFFETVQAVSKKYGRDIVEVGIEYAITHQQREDFFIAFTTSLNLPSSRQLSKETRERAVSMIFKRVPEDDYSAYEKWNKLFKSDVFPVGTEILPQPQAEEPRR